jgi:hypothetical protein
MMDTERWSDVFRPSASLIGRASEFWPIGERMVDDFGRFGLEKRQED